MTVQFNWMDVVDRPQEPLEFGVCHVHYGWRRHSQVAHKFQSLAKVFQSNRDGVLTLLQEVGGNRTSEEHPERGIALFAAVWYPDENWAILCDAIRATLVRREQIELIEVCKIRNDNIVEQLRSMLEQSSLAVCRELNTSFYEENIASQ